MNYEKSERNMKILEDICIAIQLGQSSRVRQCVQQALNEGIDAKTILDESLMKGIDIIGVKFKVNEVYVPEVLIAARAMNIGIEILKPYFIKEGIETRGVAVLGTVHGDMHDIGKNLVKIMMEGKGIVVIDLGFNVSAEKFVDAAIEYNANLICCSALLTTTIGYIKNVILEAEKRGIRDKVKILIGGAPVTQKFCDSIGADGYTDNASSAADAALAFCVNRS